jgi:DNA-binding IclR family transcriptional regulator
MAATSAAAPRRRRPKKAAPPSGGNSEQYASKAISRALDVLDCFTSEEPQLSLRQIASRMELPESSLFRILLTLEGRGHLRQNADGTYELTRKVLFGKLYERSQALRELARPFLEKLVGRFDETASLAYLFDDKIQVLDTVESLHIIKFTNRVGRVLPPHASSLGKAITAFQPPERIEQILEAYGLVRRTEKTITDRQRLLLEFERIRAAGYACDREETALGGVCFGAAVRANTGPVVAAVSVSTPVIRLNPERKQEIIAAVVEAARGIALAVRDRQAR